MINAAAIKNLRNVKLITYLLGFLSFILLVFVLKVLTSILIPVTIAVFLTYLFHPVVLYFRKFKIPSWVTIMLIILFLALVNYLVSLLIIANFNEFLSKSDTYAANLKKLQDSELIRSIGIKQEDLNLQGLVNKYVSTDTLNAVLTFSLNLLMDFFLALIFFIFMLSGKTRFEKRLQLAFESKSGVITGGIDSINKQLQSYLVVKTIISLFVGFASYIVFLLFHIDFALFWGFLTFLFNYIPNIGAVLASVFPIGLAIFQYGLGFQSIIPAVLLLIIHNAMGNLVEPHFLGKQMDLSPVFVLLSLIFWGWIWGVPGMFLAVPIAAVLKIIVQNIKPLEPLSKILGHKL